MNFNVGMTSWDRHPCKTQWVWGMPYELDSETQTNPRGEVGPLVWEQLVVEAVLVSVAALGKRRKRTRRKTKKFLQHQVQRWLQQWIHPTVKSLVQAKWTSQKMKKMQVYGIFAFLLFVLFFLSFIHDFMNAVYMNQTGVLFTLMPDFTIFWFFDIPTFVRCFVLNSVVVSVNQTQPFIWWGHTVQILLFVTFFCLNRSFVEYLIALPGIKLRGTVLH